MEKKTGVLPAKKKKEKEKKEEDWSSTYDWVMKPQRCIVPQIDELTSMPSPPARFIIIASLAP